jgi:hypothetical protein
MDTASLRMRLTDLVAQGQRVVATTREPPTNVFGPDRVDVAMFQEWAMNLLPVLRAGFGEDSEHVNRVAHLTKECWRAKDAAQVLAVTRSALTIAEAGDIPREQQSDPLKTLGMVCDRFHLVVRQLRARHAGRATLSVKDEYDVQDLLHAVLRIFFEDVRAEEWTPSYAGGSSRMDFLVKDAQLVIETKMARKSLTTSDLGAELIVDIARYAEHADCKTLVCFVYDPEGLVRNPRAIESDLSRPDSMVVKVFVRPL